MRALPPLLALVLLSAVAPPATATVKVCAFENAEVRDYPCVEYHDDEWDCGLLGPRCVCLMFYEDFGASGQGRCVVLPAVA